jgi:hypothetical protein
MAQYTVQAPDGQTITLEGPDGASQADVIAQAQKLYQPKASVEVSAAPSQFGETGGGAAVGRPQGINRTNVLPEPRPLESALAGATKSFVDPMLAGAQLATGNAPKINELVQRLAKESGQYQEENPTSYGAGRIGGAVLPAMGAAKVIGAIPSFAKLNPYLQAGAIGGAVGAATPEETGKTGQPFYQEAAKQATIGAALGAPTPLLGKIADVGIRATKSLAEPFYEGGQNVILGRALRQFAGNDAEKAIANLRSAKELVPGSMPTVGEAAGVPSLAAAQRAAIGSSPIATNALAGRQLAQNEARTSALENIAPETRVAKYSNIREEVANDLYDKALNVKLALAPEDEKIVSELIKTPAISKAINQAKENAANRGVNIADPAGSMRGLHETKMALDDQISAVKAKLEKSGTGATSAELRSLISAKDRLLGFIEDINPAYKEASSTFARLSKPVNQLETIANLSQKSISPQTQNIYAANFARELEKVKKEGILSKQQLARLEAISEDLQRNTYAKTAGAGIGSNTMEKLAYNNMLQQVNLPNMLRRHGLAETAGNILARISDVGYGAANKQLTNKMAEALLDPKKSAALMKLAGKAETASHLTPEQANMARILATEAAQRTIKGVGNE